MNLGGEQFGFAMRMHAGSCPVKAGIQRCRGPGGMAVCTCAGTASNQRCAERSMRRWPTDVQADRRMACRNGDNNRSVLPIDEVRQARRRQKCFFNDNHAT